MGKRTRFGRWILSIALIAGAVGALIMAAGGFISLSDRRFRIGAPHRVGAAAATPAGA